MRPKAWVVVLWEDEWEGRLHERCYCFPGEFHALGSFDLERQDPFDSSSPLVLRCVAWAASQDEAVRTAHRARRAMIDSGLWQRLPLAAGSPANGLIRLDSAVSGAQQAIRRTDAAARNGSGRHQTEGASLAES